MRATDRDTETKRRDYRGLDALQGIWAGFRTVSQSIG